MPKGYYFKNQNGLNKHTIETKLKMSAMRKGENNANWRGGIPKCQDCGGNLSKYNYPKRGVKRCIKCYSKTLEDGTKHWNYKGGLSKTKEYKAHYNRIKRDKRRGASGKHTLKEWNDLKKKYNYMCLCCKRVEPEIKLTIDHIIPLSKGGTNYISNIQPLCKSCNSIKYNKIINFTI